MIKSKKSRGVNNYANIHFGNEHKTRGIHKPKELKAVN